MEEGRKGMTREGNESTRDRIWGKERRDESGIKRKHVKGSEGTIGDGEEKVKREFRERMVKSDFILFQINCSKI